MIITFTTSLDKFATRITYGITILFIVIIGALLFSFNDRNAFMRIFISIWLAIIYLTAYILKPGNYILMPDKLIINRTWKRVTINRSDIQSVEILEPALLYGSIRTFGVGGLFGYFGKFANRKLGSMTWYVTRRDKPVLITTIANKKIIVSPDRAEDFKKQF